MEVLSYYYSHGEHFGQTLRKLGCFSREYNILPHCALQGYHETEIDYIIFVDASHGVGPADYP